MRSKMDRFAGATLPRSLGDSAASSMVAKCCVPDARLAKLLTEPFK
jgi:hypothetical protein